eukprot:jgi/Mesen1/5829/ME000297S05028
MVAPARNSVFKLTRRNNASSISKRKKAQKNSLGMISWKDVTPVEAGELLMGSDEGGFMGLEEIDGDVYFGEPAAATAGEPDGPIAKKDVTSGDHRDTGKGKKKAAKASEVSEAQGVDASVDEPLHTSDLSKGEKRKKAKRKRGQDADVEQPPPAPGMGASQVAAAEHPDSSPGDGETATKASKRKKKKKEKGNDEMMSSGSPQPAAPGAPNNDTQTGEKGPTSGGASVAKGSEKNGKKGQQGKQGKSGKGKKERANGQAGCQDSQEPAEGTGGDAQRGGKEQQQPEEAQQLEEEEEGEEEQQPEEQAEEEVDMSAWAELRLHPELVSAVAKLGFSQPTAIQRACIPAAAHQGKAVAAAGVGGMRKWRDGTDASCHADGGAGEYGRQDVVGAAETGSGKTLAFGLPILQRLLDERRKEQGGPTDASEGSPLRALILTPTRELALQVTEHLKAVARPLGFHVVAIVGGMAVQKQQRQLRRRPHVVVATPGRLWELMTAGETQLLQLHALSFFVLDEADRMVERGHFRELRSIVEHLPPQERDLPRKKRAPLSHSSHSLHSHSSRSHPRPDQTQGEDSLEEEGERRTKKRQTMVFSATLALPPDFRQKLKRGAAKAALRAKAGKKGGAEGGEEGGVEALMQRAGMSHTAAVLDLTTRAVVAGALEEAVIECMEDEKDVQLAYVLRMHASGRTLVFCTAISAVRRVAALLALQELESWPLHAQMQQRQRLKTAAAAAASEGHVRCMEDEKDVQLAYVLRMHASGRTLVFCTAISAVRRVAALLALQELESWPLHAQMQQRQRLKAMDRFKASTNGVLIATDVAARGLDIAGVRTVVHYQLPHSAEERLAAFPVDARYLPQVRACVALAIKLDTALRKASQSKAQDTWARHNALMLDLEHEPAQADADGDGDGDAGRAQKGELKEMVQQPLTPKFFSRSYATGGGMSALVAQQLQTLKAPKVTKAKATKAAPPPLGGPSRGGQLSSGAAPFRKPGLTVIGQESSEALVALRRSIELINSQQPASKSRAQPVASQGRQPKTSAKKGRRRR